MTLKLTLSLDASPTNNAEIEFGDVIFGWDCGEWFVRGDRLRSHFSAQAANPTATGRRTLTARIRLDARQGGGVQPSSVVFEERWGEGIPPSRIDFEERWGEGVPPSHPPVSFGGGVLPAWFDPGKSDALLVTSRGGAQNVSAAAACHVDGTLVIVR
jgi:hypothetical protein